MILIILCETGRAAVPFNDSGEHYGKFRCVENIIKYSELGFLRYFPCYLHKRFDFERMNKVNKTCPHFRVSYFVQNYETEHLKNLFGT